MIRQRPNQMRVLHILLFAFLFPGIAIATCLIPEGLANHLCHRVGLPDLRGHLEQTLPTPSCVLLAEVVKSSTVADPFDLGAEHEFPVSQLELSIHDSWTTSSTRSCPLDLLGTVYVGGVAGAYGLWVPGGWGSAPGQRYFLRVVSEGLVNELRQCGSCRVDPRVPRPEVIWVVDVIEMGELGQVGWSDADLRSGLDAGTCPELAEELRGGDCSGCECSSRGPPPSSGVTTVLVVGLAAIAALRLARNRRCMRP